MANTRRAFGFLEVQGYSVALAAMDMACKTADIAICGIDSNNPDPGARLAIPVMVQVKFTGSISGVEAALAAARAKALRHVPEEAVLAHAIPAGAGGLASLIGIGKVSPAERRPDPQFARSDGRYDAIGLVELEHFATAVQVTDLLCKSAYVEYLHAERYLGGKLVTVVFGGRTADVQAAMEAAIRYGEPLDSQPIKAAVTVANPHPEIMRFICRDPAEPPAKPKRRRKREENGTDAS